jgi:hypothetical protein
MPIHIMFRSIVGFEIEFSKEVRKGRKKLCVCKTDHGKR